MLKVKRVLFLLPMLLLGFFEVSAQCPLCKSAVVSSMQGGGRVVGSGLNPGILIMLASVYAVIFILAAIWFVKYRKAQRLNKA